MRKLSHFDKAHGALRRPLAGSSPTSSICCAGVRRRRVFKKIEVSACAAREEDHRCCSRRDLWQSGERTNRVAVDISPHRFHPRVGSRLDSAPTDVDGYRNLRHHDIHQLFRHDNDFPDYLSSDERLTFSEFFAGGFQNPLAKRLPEP